MFFPQSIPEMPLPAPLRIGDVRGCFAETYAGSSDADHVATELSAEEGHQLCVPVRFAHGVCKLTPGCEMPHKVTACSDRDATTAWPTCQITSDIRSGECPEK